MSRPPPTPTLFPYTTLFRSARQHPHSQVARGRRPGHRDPAADRAEPPRGDRQDRKSTRLNSSHRTISYAVFCLKKKKKTTINPQTNHRYCYDTNPHSNTITT